MAVFLSLIVGLLVAAITYRWMQVNRIRSKLKWIPQVPGLPVLGNALEFTKPTVLLNSFRKHLEKHDGLCTIELATYKFIIASNQKFLEFLLGKMDILNKSDEYKFLDNWLGTGILTTDWPKWKKTRKILTPAFHFSILDSFTDIFENNGDILVEKLEKETKEDSVEISSYVSMATLDITCVDYNIARSKARRAEETSDLATSEDELFVTNKKRRIIRRQYSTEGEENDSISYQTPPKLKRKLLGNSQKANMSQNDNTIINVNIEREIINAEQIEHINPNPINTNSDNHQRQTTPLRVFQIKENVNVGEAATPTCGESCTCCPHVAKYLKELLRQQHLTRALLNDILHRLESKGETEPQAGTSSVFKTFNCPLKTQEEFVAFNDHFKNEEYVADAVCEIARFGGTTIYDFVKRALTFFMTNDLAVGYSWLGRRTKASFNNLSLAQLIISAAEKANKATDRKCTEESISKWLRRAGDRQKRL